MSIDASALVGRSWLFAPGDSDRKMENACTSAADIVILDLEDSVSENNKEMARAKVAQFLSLHKKERHRLWVRINPLQTAHSLKDLASVIPAGPGGVVLPKARGATDAQTLNNYIEAMEVLLKLPSRAIALMILSTETPEGIYTTGDYEGIPRLKAMCWGAEDLANSLGGYVNSQAEDAYEFTYELARSLCLIGAGKAAVLPIDTVYTAFRDLEGLRRRVNRSRRDGFRGMLAIHPVQIDIINDAFTPNPTELAEAQEIVDLFDSQPRTGTIGYKGRMLDRPHLSRAQNTLRRNAELILHRERVKR